MGTDRSKATNATKSESKQAKAITVADSPHAAKYFELCSTKGMATLDTANPSRVTQIHVAAIPATSASRSVFALTIRITLWVSNVRVE
jgi:hypothetical protein